jgi:hypothetical protein
MNMNKLFSKILLVWGLFWVLMIVLFLVYLGLWAIADSLLPYRLTVAVVFAILYTVALLLLMAWFWKRLTDAHYPPDYRFAQQHGLPTRAKVVSIRRTRWKRKRSAFSSRPTFWEYELELQVQPANGSAYHVQVAQFIHPHHIPKKGAVIEVKVHPDKPEVVYLSHEPVDYRD